MNLKERSDSNGFKPGLRAIDRVKQPESAHAYTHISPASPEQNSLSAYPASSWAAQ